MSDKKFEKATTISTLDSYDFTYERSIFDEDWEPTAGKLTCQWCEEEVPEDELYHGVCLTCIENYYDPELARQFIEDAGIEAYFYVGE